jgi:hypothetical protein
MTDTQLEFLISQLKEHLCVLILQQNKKNIYFKKFILILFVIYSILISSCIGIIIYYTYLYTNNNWITSLCALVLIGIFFPKGIDKIVTLM